MEASPMDLKLLERTMQPESRARKERDALESFVGTSDREPPWFFEGRLHERASIVGRCERSLDEFRRGVPQRAIQGGVIVVQGPPGAGKTSLVNALSEMKWKKGEERGGSSVAAVVQVKAEEIRDEEMLAGRMRQQLAKAGRQEARNMLEGDPEGEFREMGVQSAMAMAEATLAVTGHLPQGMLPSKMKGFLDFASKWGKTARNLLEHLSMPGESVLARKEGRGLDALKTVPKEAWNAPVLVLVDEFQEIRKEVREARIPKSWSETASNPEDQRTWSKESVAKACSVMQRLHRGMLELPVVTVCAGLSDTWRLLQDMELTRTSESLEFNIDCLEREEAIRLARRMMDECGIRGTEKEGKEWSELVADRTEGYPQHLHNGLVMLGKMLEGKERRLSRIDMDEWQALEARNRHRIYVRRRSVEMQQASPVVASVMQEMGEGGLKGDEMNSALRNAASSFGTGPGKETAWVGEMNVEWMKQHLLHQGAVQKSPDDEWKCGIRSFRTWLSMAEHPLHQAVLMRDEKRIMRQLSRGRDPRERCLDGRTALEIAEDENIDSGSPMRIALEEEAGRREAEEGTKGKAWEISEEQAFARQPEGQGKESGGA